MGLKICNLFSGSSGNCTYIASDTTELIIDAGVPAGRIEKALKVLGADPSQISVLVTHRHSDHIGGLAALVRKYPQIKVYAHERVADDLIRCGADDRNTVRFGQSDFYVGDITVTPVKLSHDVYCVGFCFTCEGKKISYITDTGLLPPAALAAASDSDLVMIESNHSPELLAANGNYSYALKRRIASDRGHLSNDACAQAVVNLAKSGVKHFILAHLSKENNYPELAYSVSEEALSAAGISGVGLSVALADKLGSLIKIV